ncbi:MAG TPA: RES family NAD+ phosphorylase [Longimicrobium sp.]|nr:RES family NAD+ phosphorylase [Longimicrobium sp.]
MVAHPPEPPADLHARRLPFRTIDAGTPLWRVHDAGRHPVWFGPAPGVPPRSRFDAPGGEFRVCYVALTPEAAFAETFLRNPGRRMLDATLIDSRALSTLAPTRALRVVRLHGPGLARVGATAEVSHGPAYDVAHRWALALWSHPSRPDGILYTSRHDDDEFCVALFERDAGDLRVDAQQALIGTPLLTALLRRYRVSLDPSS